MRIHRRHFFVSLFLLLSVCSAAVFANDLKKAPASFLANGSPAVFIDILSADYVLTYDLDADKVVAESTLIFVQEQDGQPILNFQGTVLAAEIDGFKVGTRPVSQPAPFLIVESALAPGEHQLRLRTERPLNSNGFSGADWIPSLLDYFDMSDETGERGRYLDAFLPTNLAFDQYPMHFRVDASRSSLDLYFHLNGVVTKQSKNVWEGQTPGSYNCSSVLFALADLASSQVLQDQYTSTTGKTVRIELLIGKSGADLREDFKDYLASLEKHLDVWPYDHLIYLQNGRGGGMEYAGAFMNGHHFHELLHSYFARGIYPVDGNAEWFDEYVATAVDEGDLGKPAWMWDSPGDLNLRYGVSGFSAYQQGTPVCPHNPSPILFWNKKFKDRGGIIPFLKHLLSRYIHKTISTSEIKAEMESFYQTDLTADFDKLVFAKGVPPTKAGSPYFQYEFHPK